MRKQTGCYQIFGVYPPILTSSDNVFETDCSHPADLPDYSN